MLRLYPDNPHYLEYNGKPLVAVGSGEHYGAALNRAFDYVPYLDELARHRLNQVRVFSGTYRELPGSFEIASNNLAPRPDDYLCPWARGGEKSEKWDLSRWDARYWQRLKDFVAQAKRRGILVEYVLFCFWYSDALWQASPMHPHNNTQNIGPTERSLVFTVENNPLLPFQEALVKKAVAELAPFGNVYVELANEPYSRNDNTWEEMWHRHLAQVVKRTHNDVLIAANFRNNFGKIEPPIPEIAIWNFHYATPRAVHENHALDRVIADDETGFAGQSATPYQQEAWRFLLSGGGIFSHLDYSFTVEQPDGSAPIVGKTPGYGGADLRRQLGFLRQTLEKNQVWKLRPLPERKAPILSSGKNRSLVYVENTDGAIELPAGTYEITYLDPVSCRTIKKERREHPDPATTAITLTLPENLTEACAVISAVD